MLVNIQMPSIYPVACHTDFVGQGTIFVAIQGFKIDGMQYIEQAITKGATTIVVGCDVQVPPKLFTAMQQAKVRLLRVQNTRLVLAQLSAHHAGNPADQLKIVAVTGTKGKTTTASLLAHIYKTAGYKVALVSTAHNVIDGTVLPAPLTTPQPDYLQQFLKLCVQQGITHVIMEVAAQAVTLYRIHGILFDGIIFTNFDRDHLEFYATMEDYFAAKCALLNAIHPDGTILVNKDNEWTKSLALQQHAFSMHTKDALVHVVNVKQLPHELHIVMNVGTTRCELVSRALQGAYNVYNILAAVGLAVRLGISASVCTQALATFAGVPGRFEIYMLSHGARCVIDSAHNPISFQAILSTLRTMTDHLIVVFGAGGERDAGRRPMMGAIVAEFADLILVTTDNPRSEDPTIIAHEIVEGIQLSLRSKVTIELDRAIAIRKACAQSKPTSIIALLGKGAEQYQIINSNKIPFSERSIVQELAQAFV